MLATGPCRAGCRTFSRHCTSSPFRELLHAAPTQRRERQRLSVAMRQAVVEESTITSKDQTKLDVLLDRFKMFDVDGNGRIDREELRMLLESVDDGTTVMLSQHWLPEDELDRVMATYDKDGNGVIDFEEFQSIIYDGLLLDGQLSEYEEAFRAVDKSGNGTIGAMELMELFKSLGNPISFERLSDIMLQYDRDESGQIEFNEFLLMFRDELLDLKDIQNYLAGTPEAPQSQAWLDTQDGEVSIIFSEQELEEMFTRTDKLTLVFAAMTWCRPCKAMHRPVVKLAQHFKDSFNFVKLFGNSNEQTKRMFKKTLQIRSTPCFMIFNGDKLLYTQTGRNSAKLEEALRSFTPESKLPAERLYEEEE